jgi:division protein CdvB (Snf7/Vps24/ESCRT-III family)
MADLTEEIQKAIDEKQIELSEVNAKLTDLLDKFAAAVAANKRVEEEKTAESFYCL